MLTWSPSVTPSVAAVSGFQAMMVWCMDLMSSAWLCVGVQCDKSVVLSSFFSGRHRSSKKGPTLMMYMVVLGLPARYNFSWQNKSPMPGTQGKRVPNTQKDQSYRTTLCAGPGPSFYMNDHFTQRRGLQRYFTKGRNSVESPVRLFGGVC